MLPVRSTQLISSTSFHLLFKRIMWCFFYEPERLPKSYVKWITSLADMDQRIILALQAIRERRWKYSKPSPACHDILGDLASEMRLNRSLGDPTSLPAYGGKLGNAVWDSLGYDRRRGVGGIPCEIVHCNASGNSCTGNAVLRGIRGFGQALLIYAPVHVLPPLISNPRGLLTDPVPTVVALFRSAAFLSTFISSIWFTVCSVRTLFIARLFPFIPHDFWDGPQGCILAGCLVCGASIGIERGSRRGEIALYVMPRAIRACLPAKWIKSGSWTVRNLERLTFVWSLASLLTMAIHKPEALRGIARWTLGYIMQGKKTRSKKPNQTALEEEHQE
ncbi:hypothetical protein M422DRAFT_166523 [Sphaerobolus stellatus SS14]|uniref:Transmembrane protein 135 N-terminal domain-containing protein n=1 Tax=Sphaerobolus stellatus (strain SS14) TaxID=990650 RepID=A0A0C9W1X7_SPHS4|nr:hypothetical protein M422DRAFT_166523 [Sphaerobolus stellatus SS14]